MKGIHFCLGKRKKLNFEIHLCEHCNLNCKGCDNFSPLAEECFIRPEDLKKQFMQIYKIFGEDVSTIKLLGGEPLLHPDICELLKIAREEIPHANLVIVTNGVRIPKMPESFFKCCEEYRVSILMTKYPIKVNYNQILKNIKKYDIDAGFYSNEELKTLYRKPLDIKGNQNGRKMFNLCLNANRCVTLKDGKLYTCTTIPNIVHFNKYFNKDIEVSKDDYINIFECENKKQIKEFLSKPVPFCKYCKIANEQFGIPWTISQKVLEEWADE